MDNNNEVATDSYVESVFNEESSASESSYEGALESWDDVPVEGDINEDLHEDSEVSSETDGSNDIEDGDQTSSEEEGISEETNNEDVPDSDEDQSENQESGEESEQFTIPEELQEKGLVASDDGQIGKIVKIDGEEVFVSIDDLGNDYSGQKALQQRFTELDKENKEFKAEVDIVNGYVNTFRDKMQGENGAEEAMKYLGELAGIPGYVMERQLMQAMAPRLQELSQMTPEQIQAKYTQQENEYLKQSLESENERQVAEQASMELQNDINYVRETHGIADEEWDEALNYVRENEDAIRESLGDQPIDAQFVGDLILDSRAFTKAEDAFNSAGVELNESNSELLNQLTDISKRNPDFTNEDLVELVQSAKKSAVESKVTKGMAKRKEKNGSSKAPKKTNTNPISQEEESYLDEVWG